jgi:hypothetical protein
MSPPSTTGAGRDVSLTPTGSFAAVFNGDFDPYYRQSAIQVSNALSQHGYTVLPPFNGPSFSPKALADFGDADVVFVASHGGGPPSDVPHIATGLHRDDSYDGIYKQCLTEGSILWSTYEFGGVTYGPYYAVTSQFVANYIKPCPRSRSLVFVSACKSLEPAQALADAFRSRGMDVTYLGWVGHPKNDKAPIVEGALLDLLTARRSVIASADIPPSMVPSGNTADNPFNLTDSLVILHAMASYEAAAGTMLDFVGNSQWGVMPHLDDIYVTGNSRRILCEGWFGPAAGTVTVGQTALAIDVWDEAEIACTLPSHITGPLVASVNGVRSNPLLFLPVSVSVEHYYPESYFLGVGVYGPGVVPITVAGPSVVTQWQNPEVSEQHIVVVLGGRPIPDDIYEIQAQLTAGTASLKYTVRGVSDRFAWLSYPANGSTISTTAPRFTWSAVAGIQVYGLVVQDSSGHWVWSTHGLSAATTSVQCGASLQRGATYTANLHTFDANGDQATTLSQFQVQ